MLPLTRKENWLAKIAGDPQADEAMTPRTREEYFLNEIAENGGGGGGTGDGVLVVNIDADTQTLDKTWQEIDDAPMAVLVSTTESSKHTYVVHETAYYDDFGYAVTTLDFRSSAPVTYLATTADGYPTFVDNGGGE